MATRFLVSGSPAPTASSSLKAKRDAALLAEKEAALADLAKTQAENRDKLAAKLTASMKALEQEAAQLVEKKRAARATFDNDTQHAFHKQADPKVALVIRLANVRKEAPRTRKILALLRLQRLNDATLLRLHGASRQLLTLVAPKVTYGTPSLKTLRELLYKRGYAKINGQRVRISSNEMVAEHLGHLGILGVDDLALTLWKGEENFKEANQFLWPFQLKAPKGGFIAKRHGFVEARNGDWGNRGALINKLVARMN